MRRIVLLVSAVLLLLLSAGSTAFAHATLQQATPAPDSILAEPAATVELKFSEEVEAQFGAIAVYDHTGARVDRGDAALDPSDVTRVVAALKELSDGLYTVSWRVVSVDGHPISGSYGFTVGRGIPGAQYYQPAVPDANGTPPVGVLVGYWLAVIGAMVVTGLSLMQRWVLREEPSTQVTRLVWTGLSVALVGTVVYLAFRTAQAAGIPVGEAVSPVLLWRMLLTETGRAVLGRLLLLVTGLLLMPRLGRRWWFGAAVGSALLLTFPLGGHSVALRPACLAVLADFVHLLAAAAWLGGLLQFAVAVPQRLRGQDPAERTVQLGRYVRRFSAVAGASILLLLTTSLYPIILHVPSAEALVETAYGAALQVKVLLFGLLVILGAVNLVFVGPRLMRGQPVENVLKWLVRVEVALVALVLAAAAYLTNVPPARVALPPEVLHVGLHTQDYGVLLKMDPLAPGYRTLDVLLDWHEGELPPETKVSLELTPAAQEIGRSVATGTALGDGHYHFSNLLIGVPGTWEFRLQIARPGAQVETITREVEVPEAR